MVKPVRKSSSKNPPIFSQEFIIQNHADIISCVAMVFVVGLMVQATSPIASVFIVLQHNITEAGQIPQYLPGPRDWCSVFFYSFIMIIFHAILQEYVLDKISKKLHLSKSKLAVFNTSGQLASYYLLSSIWGLDIILRQGLFFDISQLWLSYPTPLSFLVKLFIIIQLAYKVHELPELYFQRVKKDEYLNKAIHSVAGLAFIAVPYFLNFNNLLVCLIVLHFISEFANHSVQLLQIVDKEEKFSKVSTMVSNSIFVLVRLASITMSVLTLWYGLALSDNQTLDIKAGNFNVPVIRLALLGGICAFQAYLMYNFITQYLRKIREKKNATIITRGNKLKKGKETKEKKTKKHDDSDLPEVDQNTNKIKMRSQAKANKTK